MTRLRPGGILAASLAALAVAVPAGAQEEPAMPDAPTQFRLSLSGSGLLWGGEGELRPGDLTVWGIDLERLLFRHASVRVAAGYGRGSVAGPSRSTDVGTYLVEVVGVGRLAVGPLHEETLIPFAVLGIGTIVHDPAAEDLTTRSQNALAVGGGVEGGLAALGGPPALGLRVEWRRYEVNLENLFDRTDRSGRSRSADRIVATFFWKF